MPAPISTLPPDAQALLASARRHAATLYGPPEVLFVRGGGSYLIDASGRSYLDWAGGMGVNLLGHGHPRVAEAITKQLATLWHTSNAFLSPAPILLAERLAELTGLEQSFFVNAGTEAMEGAIKLVRRYHHARGKPRQRIVAFERGFHGRTLGALSITGQPKMHEGFGPMLLGVDFVPFGELVAALKVIGPETAAVVVEPLQGNGGVRLPPPDFLPGLREATLRHGALLVCDEVQTGLGRCGSWLLSEQSGVLPDVVTLAKGLGGGLPLGAVMASREVMASLQFGDHGSTFGGNPVACAAALAMLDVVADEGLLQRAQTLGVELAASLATLPHVAEVRGRGLLWGLHVPALDLAALRHACLEEGMLTTAAGSDVLRLFVPAITGEVEIAVAHDRLGRALRKTADMQTKES